MKDKELLLVKMGYLDVQRAEIVYVKNDLYYQVNIMHTKDGIIKQKKVEI